MKNFFVKRMIAFVLVIACVLCTAACTKKGQPDDAKKTAGAAETQTPEATDAIENPEESVQSGKPAFLGASSTDSGLRYYLKLDAVEGESKDAQHSRWIEVTDFSFGASQEIQEGTPYFGASGMPEPVTFTHKLDKATPNLQKYCMNGYRISSGRFEAVKTVAGQNRVVFSVTFDKIKLVNAAVETAVDANGASYLTEKVSMLVGQASIDVSETDSGNSGSGLSYYLKLDGIEGSSENSKHARWIDVISFSHGASRNVQTGSPSTPSESAFEPVVFVHRIDSATAKLEEYCLKGNYINTGELQVMKSVAGVETLVYKIALEDARLVKTVVKTVTDENGASFLAEEVTMLVNKETWTVSTIGIDNTLSGSTEAAYDQVRKS